MHGSVRIHVVHTAAQPVILLIELGDKPIARWLPLIVSENMTMRTSPSHNSHNDVFREEVCKWRPSPAQVFAKKKTETYATSMNGLEFPRNTRFQDGKEEIRRKQKESKIKLKTIKSSFWRKIRKICLVEHEDVCRKTNDLIQKRKRKWMLSGKNMTKIP